MRLRLAALTILSISLGAYTNHLLDGPTVITKEIIHTIPVDAEYPPTATVLITHEGGVYEDEVECEGTPEQVVDFEPVEDGAYVTCAAYARDAG